MRARLHGLIIVTTLAAAAAAATPVLPGAVAGAAAADLTGGQASAVAEAVRVQVDSPGAPASDRPVEFGFPSSSATVSGLEGSSATAALADPGEIVLNGPGLCKAVYPQCPDLPAYPFIVNSRYGTTNEAKAAYGQTALEAVSQAATSKGSATTTGGDPKTAGGQNISVSTGTLDPATGVAHAEASTLTDALSFGDTLQIGSVHSTASVSQQPGNELVRHADLAINGLLIAGQALGITQNGLVLGNSATPLPAGNPFDQALTQAGITLRWLAGYNTKDGIVAPALEIVAVGQMPSLPAPSTLTIRLGGATARAEAARTSAQSPAFGSTSSSPAPAGSSAPAAAPLRIAGTGVSTGHPTRSGLALPDITIAGRPLDLAGGRTAASAGQVHPPKPRATSAARIRPPAADLARR